MIVELDLTNQKLSDKLTFHFQSESADLVVIIGTDEMKNN